jgi:hypothetical protein
MTMLPLSESMTIFVNGSKCTYEPVPNFRLYDRFKAMILNRSSVNCVYNSSDYSPGQLFATLVMTMKKCCQGGHP